MREPPGVQTSQGDRTPAGSRTPHGVPDPHIATGPLSKGRFRHPASGWSGAATCLQAQTLV